MNDERWVTDGADAMAVLRDEDIAAAATLLKQASCVCALTGAGVSAESGVPTFRGGGGFWEGERIEDVATPQGFRADPKRVWRFYNARRRQLREIKPNAGHHALAEMERLVSRFMLITQNVDGLHRLAGSRNVIEIHGSIRIVRCVACGGERDAAVEELPELPTCERCGGPLRPAVVWFNEMLPEDSMAAAAEAIEACDVMLVAGTSGVVQPAASFALWASRHGAKVIDVNPDPSAFSPVHTIGLAGPSGKVLPAVVEAMKASAQD
jgi:NAD-dependent deacetylase